MSKTADPKPPALKTSGKAMEADPEARKAPRTKPKAPEPQPATAPKAADKERARLAVRVVKLRDEQGKKWGEIEKATGLNGSQLRRLYNAGRRAPEAN